MVRSRLRIALVALAAVGLPGCYGSTEPATNVGVRSATLNGKGTTDQGPALAFFAYWPTQFPGRSNSTPGKQIPGGVTGPYSEPAHAQYDPDQLQPDTSYTFKLCGKDQNATQATCAQNRTFRTLRPPGEFVQGSILFTSGFHSSTANVDAHSDADGSHPGGTLELPGGAFQGTVTCLRVEGNRAVVGAVGGQASELFVFSDGGAATGSAGDSYKFVQAPGGSAPDCGSATFTDLTTPGSGTFSTVAVYDAP